MDYNTMEYHQNIHTSFAIELKEKWNKNIKPQNINKLDCLISTNSHITTSNTTTQCNMKTMQNNINENISWKEIHPTSKPSHPQLLQMNFRRLLLPLPDKHLSSTISKDKLLSFPYNLPPPPPPPKDDLISYPPLLGWGISIPVPKSISMLDPQSDLSKSPKTNNKQVSPSLYHPHIEKKNTNITPIQNSIKEEVKFNLSDLILESFCNIIANGDQSGTINNLLKSFDEDEEHMYTTQKSDKKSKMSFSRFLCKGKKKKKEIPEDSRKRSGAFIIDTHVHKPIYEKNVQDVKYNNPLKSV